jgi:hypothetical protein
MNQQNKALCPRCHKEPAIMHPSFGVTDGKKCKANDKKIKEHPEFATLSMQDRITGQRDNHLGDIAQPWTEDGKPNPVFIAANSKEDVEQQFTPEELKSL